MSRAFVPGLILAGGDEQDEIDEPEPG